ncbi:hypothetical protein [Stakelama pacifica]|uniref:Uncharacterized protein n=1 Tax=Stakelama pacifica TaxID=517720 RepID=A0A4R6FUU6_9SPHN|nr:hypothetical protein [Stakelama pacifica]TDN85591.1 hypothetical protein EV664_102298 [Stakelama pacifica]|tara:strand:+ start:918 stop:1079 length:162 start_codon:yes stop_codon:yes gene_type:complete
MRVAGDVVHEGTMMAKSQKRSNREVRKPKAEKPKKQNASNPSTKPVAMVNLNS